VYAHAEILWRSMVPADQGIIWIFGVDVSWRLAEAARLITS
jgi:hypothetical protein